MRVGRRMIRRGALLGWIRGGGALEIVDVLTKQLPALRAQSPRPPVAARPHALSVTEIKRLIRDPYAIYAKTTVRSQNCAR